MEVVHEVRRWGICWDHSFLEISPLRMRHAGTTVKHSESTLKLFLKLIWNTFQGALCCCQSLSQDHSADKEPQVCLKASSAGCEILQVWLRALVHFCRLAATLAAGGHVLLRSQSFHAPVKPRIPASLKTACNY